MPDAGYASIAQFALKAVGNYISGNKATAAALNQQTLGMQQEEMQYDRNIADNKAIAEANLTNQIRTGYKVGLLNVQAGQAKKRAMQEGFDLSKTRQQVLGAATANAAAAGTVGSSVDAVTQDIESKVGDAQAQQGVNYEQTVDNFDVQLTDLLNAGHDILHSSEKATVQKTPKAQTSGLGEALLGAAIDVGGQYLSSAMNLGLGSASSKVSGYGSAGSLLSASDLGKQPINSAALQNLDFLSSMKSG